MSGLKVGDAITTLAQLKALPVGAVLDDGDFRYLICDDRQVVDTCAMVRRLKSLYLPTSGMYPMRLAFLPEDPR